MDANDVELTESRARRDTDEVYPVEELQLAKSDSNDDMLYQPAARRQNRCFLVGVAFFVVAIGAIFGAKVFLQPGADVGLETNTLEQGTVGNNADNAKMSEVMREHKAKPGKKPHSSSSWSQQAKEDTAPETTNDEDADQAATKDADQASRTNADLPEEKPQSNTSRDNESQFKKIKKWNDIKVSKADGAMYEVLKVLKHDPNSFTEGLTFHDGKLFESVGLQSKSSLLVLDPNTGETLETYQMEAKFFGEGLAYSHGKLYQLTYKAQQGFVYDIKDLRAAPTKFQYKTTTREGWGFTYDRAKDEFIVSDGSAFLHFWDRQTLKQVRKHQIMRLDGTPAEKINELEFWRDRVVANVWFENVLLVINPVTGLVEKEYDFSTIWQKAGAKRNRRAEVFNGISVSSDPDVLYVTGKWWSNMFKIKLLPQLPSE